MSFYILLLRETLLAVYKSGKISNGLKCCENVNVESIYSSSIIFVWSTENALISEVNSTKQPFQSFDAAVLQGSYLHETKSQRIK